MLPPVSDFGVLEPLGACAAGGGDVCGGLAGAWLTGAGAGAGGEYAGAEGAAARAGALDGEEAGADWEVEPVVEAALVDVERAGADTATTGTAIGGELAKRTGIAGPMKAVETLAGSCSRGVFAGRSERPIAKKHANTAAQSSIASTIVRA